MKRAEFDTRRERRGSRSDRERSQAHTWNRVTMASGLLTLPCPPTPVTGKVRLNVTCAFVSQPRAPGLLQLLAFNASFPHRPPPAREAPGPANEVTAHRRWT